MIFGYNTDVKAGDTVYHVQTEDRGEKNPVIDSLIYVKGQILDRRLTPYVPGEKTAEQLQEMVKQQHRGLVEAIRGGAYKPADEVPSGEGPGASAAGPAAAAGGVSAPAPPAPAGKPEAAAAPPSPKASAADWSELLVTETPAEGKAAAAPTLELLNAAEIECEDQLVLRLRVSDPASGQAIAGGQVRALLRTEDGSETLQEASAGESGIAEIRFAAPPGQRATVLFQAARGGSSELLRFRVHRG
jgi:hypothetical protein